MDRMKRDIRAITYDVRTHCHLRGAKPVPHITLVSDTTPLNSKQDEKKLIADFNRVCSKYPAMEFQFNGFGTFSGNGVAKINIVAPDQMLKLRWDLICRLRGYCELDQTYDAKQDYYSPHVTIAMKLKQNQLAEVMRYLRGINPPHGHYYLARTTLLKHGKILREYDFFLRRSLNRIQALSPRILAQTRAAIKHKLDEKTKAQATSPAKLIPPRPFGLFRTAIRKLLRFFKS